MDYLQRINNHNCSENYSLPEQVPIHTLIHSGDIYNLEQSLLLVRYLAIDYVVSSLLERQKQADTLQPVIYNILQLFDTQMD